MTEQQFCEEMLPYLDGLGFEGIDALSGISLFEYGNLYSKKHGVAVLCQVGGPDPRMSVQTISEEEIQHEVQLAGPGYEAYTDRKHCGPDTPSGSILSLEQWSGGWHVNSGQWRRLSEWDADEFVRVIDNVCHVNEQSELPI